MKGGVTDVQRGPTIRAAHSIFMKRFPMVAMVSLALLSVDLRAADLSAAAESAHREVWRRFIDGSGIFLDFADLDGKVSIPTPEECREGKPNALGWWAPIENGAMFNGLYMEAAVNRSRASLNSVTA